MNLTLEQMKQIKFFEETLLKFEETFKEGALEFIRNIQEDRSIASADEFAKRALRQYFIQSGLKIDPFVFGMIYSLSYAFFTVAKNTDQTSLSV